MPFNESQLQIFFIKLPSCSSETKVVNPIMRFLAYRDYIGVCSLPADFLFTTPVTKRAISDVCMESATIHYTPVYKHLTHVD